MCAVMVRNTFRGGLGGMQPAGGGGGNARAGRRGDAKTRQEQQRQQWRKITYGMSNGPVDLRRQRAFPATKPLPKDATSTAIVRREHEEKRAAMRREPEPMTSALATDTAQRQDDADAASPIGGRAIRPRPPPQSHDEPLKAYLRSNYLPPSPSTGPLHHPAQPSVPAQSTGSPYGAAPYADAKRQPRRRSTSDVPIGADEVNPAYDTRNALGKKALAALMPIRAGSASSGAVRAAVRARSRSMESGKSPGRRAVWGEGADVPDVRRYFTEREVAQTRKRIEREADEEAMGRGGDSDDRPHAAPQQRLSEEELAAAAAAKAADAACEDQVVVQAFRHLLLSHTAYRVPTASNFYDRIKAWREGRIRASPAEILKKYRKDSANSAHVIQEYLQKLFLASGVDMRVRRQLQVDEALLDTFVGNEPASTEKFPLATSVLYHPPPYAATVVAYNHQKEAVVLSEDGAATRVVAHKELAPRAGFQRGDAVQVLGEDAVVTGSARGRIGVQLPNTDAVVSVMAWEVAASGPFPVGAEVIVTPLPVAGVVTAEKYRGRIGIKTTNGEVFGCLKRRLKRVTPIEDAPALWELATSHPSLEGLRLLCKANTEGKDVEREAAQNEKVAQAEVPLSVVPGWAVMTDAADPSAVTIAIAGTQNANDCFRDALFIPEQLSLPAVPAEARAKVRLQRPHVPIPPEFEGLKAHMGFADGATQLFKDIVPELIDLLTDLRAGLRSPAGAADPQSNCDASPGASVPDTNDAAGSLRITVTGHSLGGATSVLLAAYLHASKIDGLAVDGVYTYGAPNIFNLPDWDKEQVAALKGMPVVQLVNEADLVPRALGSATVRKLAKLMIKKGGIDALRCVTEENAADLDHYKHTTERLYYLNGKRGCEVVADRAAQEDLLQMGLLGLRPKAQKDHKISNYIRNLLEAYDDAVGVKHTYALPEPAAGGCSEAVHPIINAAFDKKDPTVLSESFQKAGEDIHKRMDGVTPGVLSALANRSEKLLPAHYLQKKVYGGQYEIVLPGGEVTGGIQSPEAAPQRRPDVLSTASSEASPAPAALEAEAPLRLDVALSLRGWLAFLEDACYNDLAWVARMLETLGWVQKTPSDECVKKDGPNAKLTRADLLGEDPQGAGEVVTAPVLLVPTKARESTVKRRGRVGKANQLTFAAKQVCDEIFAHFARPAPRPFAEIPADWQGDGAGSPARSVAAFTPRRQSQPAGFASPPRSIRRESRRGCFTTESYLRPESVAAFAAACVKSWHWDTIGEATQPPSNVTSPEAAPRCPIADALYSELAQGGAGGNVDEEKVYALLDEVRSTAEWDGVVRAFAAHHVRFHAGNLVKAMKEELTGEELEVCKAVLTESGVDTAAFQKHTATEAAVLGLVKEIYGVLDGMDGAMLLSSGKHISEVGFRALFAEWADDDELRVRALLKYGGGYNTELSERTCDEAGGSAFPLWDTGRLDVACDRNDRNFLRDLEARELDMQRRTRVRLHEILSTRSARDQSVTPSRFGTSGAVVQSSMRISLGAAGRTRLDAQQEHDLRQRVAKRAWQGPTALYSDDVLRAREMRAQQQARVYDLSGERLGPQYAPRQPLSKLQLRRGKHPERMRDDLHMYLSPLPPQQINKLRRDGKKETVTLRKRNFTAAAADPKHSKVTSNNHPSMPYGHLVKYVKHGTLPSLKDPDGFEKAFVSAMEVMDGPLRTGAGTSYESLLPALIPSYAAQQQQQRHSAASGRDTFFVYKKRH